jgi:hypothetical protein
MVVLKNLVVIIPQSFRVAHSYKELVVNASKNLIVLTYGWPTSQSIAARNPDITSRSLK